jgi:hypothetical protein
MNELDLLVEKHYKKKKKEVFSFETLLEMVADVLGDRPSSLKEEALPTAKSREKMTYDLALIPMPQFSELGWARLSTPKDGGNRPSSDPRQQLAQYMANIGGDSLREKIEAMNQFYSGEMAPENFTSQSDKISKYLSYLVTYKTLTSIFTGFNASSAGFLFEPWLAILLDAESGQQIPASGADTIADFTINKGDRPISLKAYSHGTLKVGGSFRQLISDLTGKYPVMEYIAVTKEMEGDKSDPMSVTGKLHFKSFNFTFENIADIIHTVSLGSWKKVLELPKIFWDSNIVKMSRDEDFIEKLRTPKGKEVNVTKLFDQYDEIFRNTFSSNGLGDIANEALDDFYLYVADRETGDYKKTGSNHLKKPSISAGKASAWRDFKDQWPRVADSPDAPHWDTLVPILKIIHENWSTFRTGAQKGTARGEKTSQLEYQSPEKSYIRLKQLQELDTETYRMALRHLRGVIFSDKFELTESSLDKNIESVGGENLFSYGSYFVGTLNIGKDNIQQVLERCIDELNTSILDIFASLRGLTDNINQYVSHGLEDERLITDPTTGAQAEAQNIDKKTGEMVEKE